MRLGENKCWSSNVNLSPQRARPSLTVPTVSSSAAVRTGQRCVNQSRDSAHLGARLASIRLTSTVTKVSHVTFLNISAHCHWRCFRNTSALCPVKRGKYILLQHFDSWTRYRWASSFYTNAFLSDFRLLSISPHDDDDGAFLTSFQFHKFDIKLEAYVTPITSIPFTLIK